MSKYVLVTVVDREITTEAFETEEAAKRKMKEEFNNITNIDSLLSEGNAEISDTIAWANAAKSVNWDWSIFEITKPKEPFCKESNVVLVTLTERHISCEFYGKMRYALDGMLKEFFNTENIAVLLAEESAEIGNPSNGIRQIMDARSAWANTSDGNLDWKLVEIA